MKASILLLAIMLIAFVVPAHGYSFVARTKQQNFLLGRTKGAEDRYGDNAVRSRFGAGVSSPLTMRDRSSANWFQVGDSVKVIDNVPKAGNNLKGREGIVVETWEKCDVDPTCCCAEQVDQGMAVHVRFAGDNNEKESEEDSFVHYFAEEELVKVKQETTNPTAREQTDTTLVPFDGLSCTEFKLQQLQGGEQAKRIASFQLRRRSRTNDNPRKRI